MGSDSATQEEDIKTYSTAPVEGNGTVKLEILGLAIEKDGQLKWVDTDILNARSSGFSYYAVPYTNLYNTPEKIKKVKAKLKKNDTHHGYGVFFAKRTVEINMDKVYEGRGRITGISALALKIEEISGKETHGHMYYSLAEPAYLGMEEFKLGLDEV